MPHLSKFQLNKNLEKELIKNLGIAFGKLSKTEVNDFLLSLLSKTEILMLAKRLAIVILLKENFTDVEISYTLHVTRETVARIRMSSEIRGKGYSLAIQKLNDEKVLEEFKNSLIKLAQYSVRAAGGRIK